MGKDTENFVFEGFRGFKKPRYTAIPDEIFDRLLPYLSGSEVKVLLYICRRTFGFNKDRDAISLNQISTGITKKRSGEALDHGTGLSKRHVQRALKTLEVKNIINIERVLAPDGLNEVNIYSLKFLKEEAEKEEKETTDGVGTKSPYGHDEFDIGVGTKSPYRRDKIYTGVGTPVSTTIDRQETVNNVNVAFKTNNEKISQDPRKIVLVEEMINQLGDKKSKPAFILIANALDEQTIWHILGSTKEAHQIGAIKTTKAKYFMGMAKNKAEEQGIDLGFKNGKPKDSPNEEYQTGLTNLAQQFRENARAMAVEHSDI